MEAASGKSRQSSESAAMKRRWYLEAGPVLRVTGAGGSVTH